RSSTPVCGRFLCRPEPNPEQSVFRYLVRSRFFHPDPPDRRPASAHFCRASFCLVVRLPPPPACPPRPTRERPCAPLVLDQVAVAAEFEAGAPDHTARKAHATVRAKREVEVRIRVHCNVHVQTPS